MMIIQAILFDKDYFPTTQQCREWLNEQNIDYIKPAMISEKYITYKIVEPEYYFNQGYKFKLTNIEISSGIQLIMMEKLHPKGAEAQIKHKVKYNTI